ncbi:MAG TPA: acyltransferase family protein [Acidothermaceae bacterium]
MVVQLSGVDRDRHEVSVPRAVSDTAPTPLIRRFRPDVEGLRAIAIGLVVLYHAGVPYLSGGYVGVDVFFVISGFVITAQLLRERVKSGSNSLREFYARRMRRIVPAASLVIVATTVISFLALGAVRGRQIAQDGLWSSFFAANIHLAAVGTNYLSAERPPSPLQNYWSLAVEEQFYLVWPVLMLTAAALFARRALRTKLTVLLVLVVGSSLTWSAVETSRNATAAYFSPATRAWELGVGALIAVVASSLRHVPVLVAAIATWSGLLLIVYSAIMLSSRTAYPGTAATMPVFGAALVIIGGTVGPRAGAEWLLRRWPMQWLGKISYSWYLWHLPILTIAQERNGTLTTHDKVGLVGLSLVAAIATYAIVENPLRMSRKLAIRPLGSVVLGLGVIVATIGGVLAYTAANSGFGASSDVVVAASSGEPVTGSANAVEVAAVIATSTTIQAVPGNVKPGLNHVAGDGGTAYHDGCLAEPTQVTVGTCAFGDLGSRDTLVLYGDSHAAMWLPAFADYATRAQLKLVLLAHSGCPAPDMPFFDAVDHRRYPECDAWHRYAIGRINALAPKYVVVTSSFDGALDPSQRKITPAAWTAGTTRLLNEIAVPNVKVAVLGDIPYPQQVTADCLAAHAAAVYRCSTPRDRAVLGKNQSADADGARAGGAIYVDVNSWFCTATTCPPLAGDVVIYQNAYHITATYSQLLAGVVGDAISESLGAPTGR